MKVSVVMAVYNASEFLHEAIDSLLNQTFTDWELIAVNDCSTDNSLEILYSYTDSRIRVIDKSSNSGAAESRNLAIRSAKGDYFAIMDADDISYPNRLEKQSHYLDNNSEISIVGSFAKVINEKGSELYDVRLPLDTKELKTRLLFESAMIQSSAMCRSSIFEQYDLFYDKKYTYVEDFEFFQRASRFVSISNIPEILVAYRYSPGNISTRFYAEQSKLAIKAIFKHFQFLQIEYIPSQIDVLYSLLYEFHPLNRKERLDFERLYFSIFKYCRVGDEYSKLILRDYFIRFHKLLCAGSFGYIRLIFSVFDIFSMLCSKFFKEPKSCMLFLLFFIQCILIEIFEKLKQ